MNTHALKHKNVKTGLPTHFGILPEKRTIGDIY